MLETALFREHHHLSIGINDSHRHNIIGTVDITDTTSLRDVRRMIEVCSRRCMRKAPTGVVIETPCPLLRPNSTRRTFPSTSDLNSSRRHARNTRRSSAWVSIAYRVSSSSPRCARVRVARAHVQRKVSVCPTPFPSRRARALEAGWARRPVEVVPEAPS